MKCTNYVFYGKSKYSKKAEERVIQSVIEYIRDNHPHYLDLYRDEHSKHNIITKEVECCGGELELKITEVGYEGLSINVVCRKCGGYVESGDANLFHKLEEFGTKYIQEL